MAHNRRTQRKLDRWFDLCRFKPIHVVILELWYAALAHDRGYGDLADSIRRERDAAWWELARTHGYAKRKRESVDLVHARRGDNRSVDDCLVQIWGLHWREQLSKHRQTYPWAVGRRLFVARACDALKLPSPPPFYFGQSSQEQCRRPDGPLIPESGIPPAF